MALSIALFSLLQISAASFLVFSRFSAIEEADLRERSGQVEVLLERELASLENLAQSYAEWIDTYEYLYHRQPAYVESNYSAYWLGAQRLDGVALVGLDGSMAWSSGIASLTAGPAVHPGKRDPLLYPPDFGETPLAGIAGFADYGGVLAAYAAWPVSDDAGALPPRGVLVMIRKLGPELLATFAPGEGFGFSFLPGEQSLPTGEALVERGGDASSIVSYAPVVAPNGYLVGHWRYAMRRTWLDVARSLMLWLTVTTILAGLGAHHLASVTVKRSLLVPLVRIRDHLDRFSETMSADAPLGGFRADEMGELARHVNLLVDRVEGQTRELDLLAATDGLTGLANRRRLDSTLSSLRLKAGVGRRKPEERSVAKQGIVACCLMDVDFFKNYNDLYGHAAGDEALRHIAAAIQGGAKRPGDLPSRYGGEEFALVLPDTDEEGAVAVLERIRAAIEALAIPHAGSSAAPVVTISAGAAAMPIEERGEPLELLLERADRALYAAKRSGRNRVCAFSSLPPGCPKA